METYVLDACSLIAFFNKEPGSVKVKNLFQQARQGKCTIYMHKINVLEIYYGLYREENPEVADSFLQDIDLLPIEISEIIDNNLMREAGKLKATYRISLADSIACAEAITKNAILVTSDHHEFDIIENNKEMIFFWIR